MNTLPSSAYSGPGAPGAEAASVVTSRWVERHASRPVCMSRKQPVPYVFFACPASDLANFVRPFPSEWILPNYQGVSDEALDYFRPLIQGEPKLICENGIPVTMRPFNRR